MPNAQISNRSMAQRSGVLEVVRAQVVLGIKTVVFSVVMFFIALIPPHNHLHLQSNVAHTQEPLRNQDNRCYSQEDLMIGEHYFRNPT